MLKYVKDIQEDGLCKQVGTGTNSKFYESIGMVQKDVEKSEIDGNWYLKELCPHYTEEEKQQQKEIEEKKAQQQEEAEALAEIKDAMLTAIAINDQEWLDELKADYQAIIDGEE